MDETTDTNDQIVDPPMPADELEIFIKSLEDGYGPTVNLSTLQPQGSTPEPTPDDDEEEQQDEETPPGDDDQSSESDEFVSVNGQQYPRSEVERLFEFDKWMRANPDAAARMAEAAKPPVSSATPPAPKADEVEEFTPPEFPESLDADDPRDKILWDTHIASQKAAWDNRQALIQMQRQQQTTHQQTVERQAALDMEAALNKFRSQFTSLNDDDIAKIRNEALPFVAPTMQSYGPGKEVDALFRSMEIAAYANADIRHRMSEEATRTPTNHQKSVTRKRKLGSISGTPNSAPKTDPRPVYRTDRDMVQQFADALANEGMVR